MLDLKFVISHIDEVRTMLKNRGCEKKAFDDLEYLGPLTKERSGLLTKSEALKARKNRVSEEIAKIKKKGGDARDPVSQMKVVSGEVRALDEELRGVEGKIRDILYGIPNMLHELTPIGPDESANEEMGARGEKPEFAFAPRDHVELGERLGILDFETAGIISGARFAVLKGTLARLERALINFMLDTHVRKGYVEVLPPYMVNSASMLGTGQLPKFSSDSFKVEDTDYWLVPTAEVPVTNFLRNKIVSGDELPISFVAYTACFRKEAGSYGKDVRGLIRQHQFNKVELVRFSNPADSFKDLENLLQDAESILQLLKLPYRVVKLSSGDISANAQICYDLEVWIPTQKRYREISSCSLFGDYQARRASIRFRIDKKSKPQFVHTSNGSGLAIGRTVVAIMENFQKEDGSIEIPEVLVPYMGGISCIS